MKFLFVSKKVEICIQGLRKNGKAGRVLADKARRIIERLAAGMTCHHEDTAGSFTKYGEKRIKHCRKYNLGCGYRLIAVQRESTVYMAFLGSHDDCQCWLDNNSRLKDFVPGTGKTIRIRKKNSKPVKPEKNHKRHLDTDETDPVRHFTDRELRRVFSGLTENLKPQ